jgi:hypothetical protein
MNWQMTRPGRVRFDQDEPICMVFPIAAQAAAETEVVIRDLADDPELQAQAMAWKDRRDEFMQRFRMREPAALKAGWQRDYFLGRGPGSAAPDAQHVNKLRLRNPFDLRRRA